MGMLFARRRERKVEGVTTTENLLRKEPIKVESVEPKVKNIPTNTQKQNVVEQQPTTQPKFKI
jgi:hypothetical protein